MVQLTRTLLSPPPNRPHGSARLIVNEELSTTDQTARNELARRQLAYGTRSRIVPDRRGVVNVTQYRHLLYDYLAQLAGRTAGDDDRVQIRSCVRFTP